MFSSLLNMSSLFSSFLRLVYPPQSPDWQQHSDFFGTEAFLARLHAKVERKRAEGALRSRVLRSKIALMEEKRTQRIAEIDSEARHRGARLARNGERGMARKAMIKAHCKALHEGEEMDKAIRVARGRLGVETKILDALCDQLECLERSKRTISVAITACHRSTGASPAGSDVNQLAELVELFDPDRSLESAHL
jgi:hypothetical protein